MADIIVKALTLVAIVGVGFGVKRLGWVRASDFGMLSRVVLRITLPCALITSFQGFKISGPLYWLIAIGVVTNLAMQLAGFFVRRRAGEQAQGFAVLNVASFNMGAFATPYLAGFMGPQAIVFSSLFDVGNSLQAAGVGYGWGLSLASPQKTRLSRVLKTVFISPMFDVYLVLIILQLLAVHLPHPVLVFTQTVGSANTFLAMFMIGVGLEVKLPVHKYKLAAKYLLLRYTIAVVAALGCWFLLPFPAEVKVVLVMVMFAPIAAMTSGFTAEAGLDVELSAFMASVSILVAVVALPVLGIWLSHVG